jgi:hypothetical protein
MAEIVGVHGIMNEHVGRHQLRAEWAPALADGIERSTGHRAVLPDLDMAFYGDLFLANRRTSGSKGADDGDAPEELAGLDDAELRFLVQAADEAAGPGVEAEGDGAKRLTGPREWVARLLGRLDKVFGSHSASVLYLGALRQVHGYLRTPGLKAAIDGRVEAAVGSDCRVLIAHSLGSVVALEFLRQHPERRVDLFLTFGSPLSLRLVQELLPSPAQALESVPGNVGAWVNAWDRSDPVACAGALGGRWRGAVDDPSIGNGSSPHSALRYLSKRQIGNALTSAAPGLVQAEAADGQ